MRVFGFVLAMALTCGTAAFAQNQGGGVKAGVNFANVSIDPDVVDVGRRTGFIGGAFFTLPIAPQFSIQPEALFSQKGAEFNQAGVTAQFKLDYFEVPVLLRWDSTRAGESTFNVFAGPSFNFRARARAESEFLEEFDEDGEDISEEVERFDLGLIFGGGIEFGHVIIDARYQLGLLRVNRFPDEDGFEAKNRSFSIMGGFRF